MYEKFIVYYNDEDDLAKVRSVFASTSTPGLFWSPRASSMNK